MIHHLKRSVFVIHLIFIQNLLKLHFVFLKRRCICEIRFFIWLWINKHRALVVSIILYPSQTFEFNSVHFEKSQICLRVCPQPSEGDSCEDITKLVRCSVSFHFECSVCHTEHTDLSLTNKSGTVMMDSDGVVTCSLPFPHWRATNWSLCQSIDSHDFHVPADYASFIISDHPTPAAVHHLP